MREHRFGRIVAVASTSIRRADPRPDGVQCVAQRACRLDEDARQRGAADGVTVNMLLPGRLATDRTLSFDRMDAEAEGVSVETVAVRSQFGNSARALWDAGRVRCCPQPFSQAAGRLHHRDCAARRRRAQPFDALTMFIQFQRSAARGLRRYAVIALVTLFSLTGVAKAAMLDKESSRPPAGQCAEISALVERGAHVDVRDETGATALLIATHENNIEAARALIAAGATSMPRTASRTALISMPARAASRNIEDDACAWRRSQKHQPLRRHRPLPAAERGHVETVKT